MTASVALGALLSSAACSSPDTPPVHPDPDHAIATVYVRDGLNRGFRLEGTFSLPRMPFNRGWYADWFTFTAKPTGAVPYPPSLEAGLIRSPDHEYALQPFVAVRAVGKNAVFRAFPVIPNASHRVILESKGGTFAFSVDGIVRYRAPVPAFVTAGAGKTYLQIGHELSAPNDFAKGSITDVAFTNGETPGAAPLDTGALACYFSSNGVSWETNATTLTANGKFDAAVPDAGDCRP